MDPITDEAGRRAAEGWDAIFVATLGPYGATLAWTAIWAACAIMALVFARYVLLLGEGAKQADSKERRDYVELRENLLHGGWPANVYGRMLTAFLNGVDRFFLDIDEEGRPNWRMSAFPRAFGLQIPATLWTGASYDRCLLIALLYPIACIFAIWAISGQVGPAEAALQLPANADVWRRVAPMGGIALCGFVFSRVVRSRGWTQLLWLAFYCAGLGAFYFTGTSADAFVSAGVVVAVTSFFAVALALILALGGASAGASAVASVVGWAFAAAGAFAFLYPIAGAVAGAGAVDALGALGVTGLVANASIVSTRYRRQGAFLSLLSALMVAATLALAGYAGAFADGWERAGPLGLFLGLLTLMNAPFDWLSLGVTRGLLRRGVELGGLWPYVLGFVDFALALVLVVGLAAIMVIGVQAFDYLAGLSGAAPILPLAPLFAGIEKDPGAPEYWWIYATLFSTLIPSIFNLVMGSWSLARGLPLLSRLCVSRMPENTATPIYDRAWIATVLTLQWLFGLLLTLAGIAALGWALLSFFPQIGVAFLGWAEFVASWNLPQRANEWALRMLGR